MDNNINNNNNNKKAVKNIATFLGLACLILLIFAAINGTAQSKDYKYSEILGYFKRHEVIEYNMNLGSGKMEIKLSDGTEVNYTAPNVGLMYEDVKEHVKTYNEIHPETPIVYNLIKPIETSWIMNLLTFLLPILLMLSLVAWMFIKKISVMGGDMGRHMGFGKARTKKAGNENKKITFADVAGVDEEKEELVEIVDFLKDPKKYSELGARIPKGVLLVGPPGTGKTMLAKAVAGEAGVMFFSMSGSDFVEMYVGVGASRVRDLFEQAKKNTPCIIFIDEIDAVGRQRGAGLGGGHDEREQTLNQLLVEMDGFGINEGVIMIAATNRPDILDPALLRPGRFDRQVVVNYPDVKGREEILIVHARGKPFALDVDFKNIARSTAGFTGADLENLINEAALLAVRRGLKKITIKEIEESTIKVIMGSEKKSKIITEKDKKVTAYHESGHAIATYFCETQDKVHELSIIPRGMAGGYTLQMPEKDDVHVFKNKLKEKIIVLMGGRVAEQLVFDDVATGASHDIEQATKIATSMVTKYGMSDAVGPIAYKSDDNEIFIGRNMGHVKNYSEATASKIDDEIKNIITEGYAKTEKILKDNMTKLHEIAEFLLISEKMSGEEFKSMMEKPPIESV